MDVTPCFSDGDSSQDRENTVNVCGLERDRQTVGLVWVELHLPGPLTATMEHAAVHFF